jgi:hypothetical protein
MTAVHALHPWRGSCWQHSGEGILNQNHHCVLGAASSIAHPPAMRALTTHPCVAHTPIAHASCAPACRCCSARGPAAHRLCRRLSPAGRAPPPHARPWGPHAASARARWRLHTPAAVCGPPALALAMHSPLSWHPSTRRLHTQAPARLAAMPAPPIPGRRAAPFSPSCTRLHHTHAAVVHTHVANHIFVHPFLQAPPTRWKRPLWLVGHLTRQTPAASPS